MSSPTGPAEQFAGGSFPKSISSVVFGIYITSKTFCSCCVGWVIRMWWYCISSNGFIQRIKTLTFIDSFEWHRQKWRINRSLDVAKEWARQGRTNGWEISIEQKGRVKTHEAVINNSLIDNGYSMKQRRSVSQEGIDSWQRTPMPWSSESPPVACTFTCLPCYPHFLITSYIPAIIISNDLDINEHEHAALCKRSWWIKGTTHFQQTQRSSPHSRRTVISTMKRMYKWR